MSQTVSKETMNALPYIVAIDFDGTLVEDNYPDIGNKKPFFDKVKLYKKEHPEAKIILWTCRDGVALQAAIDFCELNGLVFDAVNRNIPEVIEMFNNDTRKVYANEYWDDKVPFSNWLWCHGR